MSQPHEPRRAGSMLSGAGVLVVGRYLVAALAWVATIIVVRQLTNNEWGEYSFIYGLVGIVGLIADLRLSRVVLRSVMEAESNAGDIIGSYIGLRLVIGVVSYAVAMAVVLIGGYPHVIVIGTAVASLNLVILSGAFGLILLFEARLWLRDIAFSNVVGMVAQLAITVAVSIVGVASILWFSWATVANGIAVLLWLLFASRHATRLRVRFDRHQWWVWLKEAAPLALGSALDTIYFRIDLVMLSVLATYSAVGAYNVGYKFSDLLGAVPLAVVTPALTMMVAAWPHDTAAFRRTFRHALIILTVGAVGAGVGFGIFAEPLVTTLYTSRYAEASSAARLLVVGQGLHFYTLLGFTTLVAVGRNRLYPIAMLAGVVLNVTLNIVLIPEYSYEGSAWATVVTELVVVGVLGWGVFRIPGIRPLPWTPIAKCTAAGLLMAAVGLGLDTVVPWPVAGLGAGIAYLAFLHFVRIDGPGGLRALAGEPTDDVERAAGAAGLAETDPTELGPGL